MKSFIKYAKTLLSKFNFGKPKQNKNGELCFVIFGLEAHNISMLDSQLQKLINLGNQVDGYGVNYTPPHQSTNNQGMIYFGTKENIEDEAFDVFLD